MHPGQGEFRPLLLHPVLPGHRVHAQASLEHQPLADLHLALQFLGQIAPAHHLQFAGGVTIPQRIEPHGHLPDRGLVVLGVANRRCINHLHFQHAVVHGPHRFRGPS